MSGGFRAVMPTRPAPAPEVSKPPEPPPGFDIRLAYAGKESTARPVRLRPGELLRDALAEHLEPPGWNDALAIFHQGRGRLLDPAQTIEDQRVKIGDLIIVGSAEQLPDPLAEYKYAIEDMKDAGAWPPPDEELSTAAAMRQTLGVDWEEHLQIARRTGFDEDEARLIFEAKPSAERQRDEYTALVRMIARSVAPAVVQPQAIRPSERPRGRAARAAAKAAQQPVSAPRPSRPVDPSMVRRLARLKESLGVSDEEHRESCRAAGLDDTLAQQLLDAGVPGDHEYREALFAARQCGYDAPSLEKIRQLIVGRKVTRDVHGREAAALGLDAATAQALYDDRLDRPAGWRFYLTALLTAADLPAPEEAQVKDLATLRQRYAVRGSLHHDLCSEYKVPPRRAAVLLPGDDDSGGVSLARLIGVAVVISVVIMLATEAGRTFASQRLLELRRAIFADRYGPDGYDPEGYDKDGFDRTGFNKEGFDHWGYDRQGFAKDGFNREGRDPHGFDRQGRDSQGRDREGRDREGYDRLGYDRGGRDRDGYDRAGFDKDGWNHRGYNQKGFDRQGYDQEGYDKDGYDKHGINRQGRDRHGLDKRGLTKEGRDKDGFDSRGLDKDGYNKQGYNREGYNRQGLDKEGFDRSGYTRAGYDRAGYDHKGFDRNGRNRAGFDRDGFDTHGRNKDGFDRGGLDAEGYDKEGYKNGYNRLGRDREGRDHEGRDRLGFDASGRDKQGYDHSGFDAGGFDRDGLDKEGYDRKGFNHDGFDRAGFDANGFSRTGLGRDGTDLLPMKLQVLESPAGYQLANGTGPALGVGQTVGPSGVVLTGIAPSSVRFTYRGRTYERAPSR